MKRERREEIERRANAFMARITPERALEFASWLCEIRTGDSWSELQRLLAAADRAERLEATLDTEKLISAANRDWAERLEAWAMRVLPFIQDAYEFRVGEDPEEGDLPFGTIDYYGMEELLKDGNAALRGGEG